MGTSASAARSPRVRAKASSAEAAATTCRGKKAHRGPWSPVELPEAEVAEGSPVLPGRRHAEPVPGEQEAGRQGVERRPVVPLGL